MPPCFTVGGEIKTKNMLHGRERNLNSSTGIAQLLCDDNFVLQEVSTPDILQPPQLQSNTQAHARAMHAHKCLVETIKTKTENARTSGDTRPPLHGFHLSDLYPAIQAFLQD